MVRIFSVETVRNIVTFHKAQANRTRKRQFDTVANPQRLGGGRKYLFLSESARVLLAVSFIHVVLKVPANLMFDVPAL